MSVAGPTVRIVPTPRSEPPTDDELAAAGICPPPAAALLLPLDLATGVRVRRSRSGGAGQVADSSEQRGPARAVAARRAPTVGRSLAGTPFPQPEEVALHEARAAEAAEVRSATRLFVNTCVEVLGGFRPVGQLRPLCAPERFEVIAQGLVGRRPTGLSGQSRGPSRHPARAATARGLGGAAVGRIGPAAVLSPPTPGRPGSSGGAGRSGPAERVAVRRVQVCDVIEGVAEVAVVLARRETVWAMAIRLEHLHGRWLCTILEIL